jgi:hypothetical protein
MTTDSSIDSRYRAENPDLAKEQDKLNQGHDLHGAGATIVGYSTPEPPDQAAKTAGSLEAKKATEKATKAQAENKPAKSTP